MNRENDKKCDFDENKYDCDFDEIKDDEMKEILGILQAIPQVPIPAQFDLNLKRALKAECIKKKTRIYKRIAAVAAVFAIGVSSMWFMEDGALQVSPASNEFLKNAPQTAMKFDDTAESAARNSEENVLEDTTNATDLIAEASTGDQVQQDKQKSLKKAAPAPKEAKTKVFSGSQADVDQYSKIPMLATTPEESEAGISLLTVESNQTPTRSFSYFKTAMEFHMESERQADALRNGIQLGDSSALLSLRDDISQEMAEVAMKLYRDLFGEEMLSLEKKAENSVGNSRQKYDIIGSGNKIQIETKIVANSVCLHEPVLDLGVWLNNQLKGCEFILKGYTIDADDSSAVTFTVLVTLDEDLHEVNELRSITWKKTE